MNGKKARKIRKSLAMTKANHREKEYNQIVHEPKNVYFRDKKDPTQFNIVQNVQRVTLININLFFYRKMKKDIANGRKQMA